MKLLLDTHLLLWAAGHPDRLSATASALLQDPDNDLIFSAASLWEIALKRGLQRQDFLVRELHRRALEERPPIHKDPFDRILIAQAMVEGITLLTVDPIVAQYPGPVRRV